MYWEVFGLVLITLYFILSLLFPKYKAEEYSNKGQEKRDDVKHKEIHTGAHEKNHGEVPSQSVDPTEGGDESCEVVRSSLQNSRSCSGAHAEQIENEINNSSREFDISSSKHKETAFPSTNEVSSVVEPTIDPLEINAIESSYADAKLSELEGTPSTDQSLSSLLKEFEEEEKLVVGVQVVEDEKNDQEMYKAEGINEEKLSSKYLYMECKNSTQAEKGLPLNDVGIQSVSDFTDKTDENNASRKPHSFESADFHTQDPSDPDKLKNINITNEIMTTPPPLQNDNHLEKFANGLASSTIETAVDNSICLSNFAENLSEKIFWDSADDVISEVHASIEKQKEDSKVVLKPVNLESLGVSVASEVVNEAIGEAALKKEYMSDDDQDLTSPQRLQPQIGYVVENVVNNAICEAALKLKRDLENDDTELVVASESDEKERSETTHENESDGDVLVLPGGNALSDESLNKDMLLVQEESTEQIEKPTDTQSIKTTDEAINSSIEIQSFPQVTEESAESLDKLEDKHYDPSFSLISKDQVSESGDHLCVETRPTDHEKVTELANDIGNEPSNKYLESEQESNHASAGKQAPSTDIETWAEVDHEEIIEPVKKASTEQIAETETVQVTEKDEANIVEKETSEPDNVEDRAEDGLKQTDSVAGAEIVKSLELQKEDLSDLNSNTSVNKDDSDSINDPPSIPEITLTVDIDSSLSSSELEEENLPSPVSSPDQINKVTLRDKGDLNGESKQDSFWRRSLILDLEEDFDPEESFSSDATSPDSPKPARELQSPQSDESGEFIDSEEDEIIDHDVDATLGAVGGAVNTAQDIEDEDFDFYDYGSDDDDENIFEPVLTVDGLCVSKQTEKKGKKKKRGNFKSVGSHYNRAIVVDNGCGLIKVGYAGDRVPRVVQQTVSAIPPRFSMQMTGLGTNLRDFKKFGDYAVTKAGVMHLSHPMKAGMIDSWTDIEDLWEHMIYDELGAEIGDNPIIMTEVAQNHKKNREKITEILFEHFNVPAMFLADQLPLSIYASGLTSGVCVSSGYSCTQTAVVYEGHTLSYTLQQLDIGGGHLTENLKMLLRDIRGRNFTSSSGWQIVNNIKEKIAFVASDYESEVHKYKTNDSLTKYYTLPDGQVIDIGYECMSCVEPLFKPDELVSADATTASQSPVHEMVNNTIQRCDADLQKMCYNNIILSGGTTNLKGFTSRLQHELHRLNHRIRKIRIPEHRHLSPWIGASILGSLPVFDDQYVTMDEYGDSGAHIIHKKCF